MMHQSIKVKIICSLIILLILYCFSVSCDHGIEPLEFESSGFSGTVSFSTPWPDSVKRAFIVVFEEPLLTPSDVTIQNLKYLSFEIPLGIISHHYSSLDSAYIPPAPGSFPAGSYAYVAIVQQSTDELSFARKDWFVSGVYYANGDTSQPGTLIIPDSTFVSDIDINVDFNNPPPQPPG